MSLNLLGIVFGNDERETAEREKTDGESARTEKETDKNCDMTDRRTGVGLTCDRPR